MPTLPTCVQVTGGRHSRTARARRFGLRSYGAETQAGGRQNWASEVSGFGVPEVETYGEGPKAHRRILRPDEGMMAEALPNMAKASTRKMAEVLPKTAEALPEMMVPQTVLAGRCR